MDNEISAYKREDDIEEVREKNKEEKYENPLLKTDFQTFITEEMSEPDISYWCNDSPEATQLLRKCIKMMNEKNYSTMKSYLKTISDLEGEMGVFKTSDGNNENTTPVNKVSFVKNFYLGIAHFKEGEYEEALECFKQAKSLHQYYQLHYNLALCCMKLNNLYDAIIYLDCVITKNPNFFFAYYNLIKIYLSNRNPSQAYVNYRRLSEVRKYKIKIF